MLEIINLANTLAKSATIALSLTGKAAAVTACTGIGVIGVCYCTHEYFEYKKATIGSSGHELQTTGSPMIESGNN